MKNLEKFEKAYNQQPVDEQACNRVEEKMDISFALQQVFHQLTEEEYELYILRYQKHLSYKQIAERFSVSETCVGVKVHRLNVKLKLIVKKLFEKPCNV